MRVLSVDPGRKNLGFCVINVDDADRSGMHDVIEFWTVIETSTHVVGLKRTLDDLLRDVAYDEVVIERQPPKNSTMKRFEHLFEMYFTTLEKPVTVVDARHKLTFASSTPNWPGGARDESVNGKGSWSYVRRKKISVSTVTTFLEATTERHESFRDVFHRAQKKDDYADALLQAQAYAHTVRYLEAEKMAARALVKPRPFPKPRPPKPGGRLTKANVVYMVQECHTAEEIESTLAGHVKARNALTTFFGSPHVFLQSRVVYDEKKRQQTQHTAHTGTPCRSPEQPLNDSKKSSDPNTNAM